MMVRALRLHLFNRADFPINLRVEAKRLEVVCFSNEISINETQIERGVHIIAWKEWGKQRPMMWRISIDWELEDQMKW